MNRLATIPIRVEAPARTGGLGSGVWAVLSELVGLLDRLAAGGLAGSIDLRSLPMSADDRQELVAALGKGEIEATLNAAGVSSIRESGVLGVWWVEHRDVDGELVAESLEVTRFPQILECAPDEIVSSASTLRDTLATKSASSAPTTGYATRQ